jgi:hypothetical protein
MEDSPRHIISDIVVKPDGEWYSGASKIENKSILLFFKKNLYADVNGLFIYNEFGSKSEKAYIKVNGPVLKVTGVADDRFVLDNEELLDIAGKEIAMDSHKRMYIVLEKLKAWAVFTRQATDDLRSRLTQKDDVYLWNNKPIRLIKKIPWFFG